MSVERAPKSRAISIRSAGGLGPWPAVTLLAILSVAVLFAVSDRRSWMLFGNSLQLALGASAISLPVATVLAFLLFRTDVRGRSLALALLGAMLFVPLYLQAAAWDAGFGLQGWFSLSCAPLGTPPLLRGWYGAMWIHALAAVPWCVLIIGAGLRFLPAELEEQALLDATPLASLWHVTLPRVMVSVAVAALWVLVTTAGEMTVTDIYQVRTFAEELYIGYALGDRVDGMGPVESRLGVLPSVAVLGCLVAAALGIFSHFAPPDVATARRRPRTFRLGRWRWLASLLVLAALLVLVGAPIGNLLYKAGVVVHQSGAERVRSWSAAKALLTIGHSPWRFRDELLWSLQIAVTAAILTIVVALPLAWLARPHAWRSTAVLLALALCLALPGPVIALSLIRLLNQPGGGMFVFLYDQTVFAPCIAVSLRALPLVTMMMWYGLRSIPDEILDAAVLDGAGPLTCLLRVALPQRVAVVAAGWVVALAVALGDLAASILVMPPGVTTLAIRVFNLVHYGVEDRLAGICLFTYAVFVLIAAAVFGVLSLRRSRGE